MKHDVKVLNFKEALSLFVAFLVFSFVLTLFSFNFTNASALDSDSKTKTIYTPTKDSISSEIEFEKDKAISIASKTYANHAKEMAKKSGEVDSQALIDIVTTARSNAVANEVNKSKNSNSESVLNSRNVPSDRAASIGKAITEAEKYGKYATSYKVKEIMTNKKNKAASVAKAVEDEKLRHEIISENFTIDDESSYDDDSYNVEYIVFDLTFPFNHMCGFDALFQIFNPLNLFLI